MTNKWTKDQDALIRSMLSQGEDHAAIAANIYQKTEQDIIRRAQQLGIKRDKVHHVDSYKSLSRGSKKKARLWRHPISETSYGTAVLLQNIEPHQCHWPVTDGHVYCGGHALEKHGYCRQHKDIAWKRLS